MKKLLVISVLAMMAFGSCSDNKKEPPFYTKDEVEIIEYTWQVYADEIVNEWIDFYVPDEYKEFLDTSVYMGVVEIDGFPYNVYCSNSRIVVYKYSEMSDEWNFYADRPYTGGLYGNILLQGNPEGDGLRLRFMGTPKDALLKVDLELKTRYGLTEKK